MTARARIEQQQFGMLTVISYAGDRRWVCACLCGGQAIVRADHLKSGATRSCGCLCTGPAVEDITGQKYGRLTVIGPAARRRGQVTWRCACDCGEETDVVGIDLRCGHTRSCGCLVREASARLNLSHGHARVGQHSSEYRSWVAMRRRCTYQNDIGFGRYGGAGVRVCDRWLSSFEAFLSDMGPKPAPHYTIDRYPDGKGNYEPSNCRWATPKEQAANRASRGQTR